MTDKLMPSEEMVEIARRHARNYLGGDSLTRAFEEIDAALQASRPAVDELREWALEKASTHHRLAHENPDLRSEHIASSSAYRSLADELAALSTTSREQGNG